MTVVARLLDKYQQQLRLPENPYLSPTERVWLAVYDPAEERRVQAFLPRFALTTEQAGKVWHQFDLAPLFSRWLEESPYREAYFAEPELIGSALPEFESLLTVQVSEAIQQLPPDGVMGVIGAGSLFGLTRVSRLIEEATPSLKGRMLLLYPGTVDGHSYRLLGARDGWNYHSVALIP